MVRIRKADPREERLVLGTRAQMRDGAVGDPVGVVALARDGVVFDLGRAGFAAAVAGEDGGEAGDVAGMLRPQPVRVVMTADGPVRGQLHMSKAAPRPARSARSEVVFA